MLFCLYFTDFATIYCTQIQRAFKLPLHFAGEYDIIHGKCEKRYLFGLAEHPLLSVFVEGKDLCIVE